MLQGSKPMLASRTLNPFSDPGWVYEIKWDGYRVLAYVDLDDVILRSRNNQRYEGKYPMITQALQALQLRAVLDGEIIAMDENGAANFQALQGYEKNGSVANLVYQVFDVLWYDGHNMCGLELLARKRALELILSKSKTIIKYSDHVDGEGTAFYEQSVKFGLEGIMAKEKTSAYVEGVRSHSWLKIKNNKLIEAIICGYTEGRNSREYFGALVLGKYVDGKLVYIGHTGTGFNEVSLKELKDRFEALEEKSMPFARKPKTNMPVTWLKPSLVCEIRFTEWTKEGVLRHPVFHGLREDKQGDTERYEEII